MAELTLQQLLKLEANPHYRLSIKQQAQLDRYRTKTNFKSNSHFKKHDTDIKEVDSGKPNNG